MQRGGLDARCGVVSNDEIGAVAEGFKAMVRGLREREAIRETFGRYVSPEVRDEILAGRVSGAGVQRDVPILFADLRDFTPWVEASPPAEVVADLNAYFSEMDAAIHAHGGLVLQFIGDEIEAVFGAPIEDVRRADAAVAAARCIGGIRYCARQATTCGAAVASPPSRATVRALAAQDSPPRAR
ncbi:adenylate/guanylate cyclase domain-containing protein [Variovorax sp. MHTC-1]|uniref:adenylate/guanylate cyclase domain-containing protein n=1 Tax=Variovorax sp. MHTC-1 TaxID=2495593 RepID=UPI000F8824E8|nr:adenylate/guanylate cyclase domain-containing protein [Variovorax sp. MHTC-1]RST54346.1 adenylate/guanylate cyclase domain-containing protein [Variovorax sp. MHTC-1]